MTTSISVKTLSAIIGIVLVLGGAGYGIANQLGLYATKDELAQTDAKATYGLHVLLQRAIAELTLLQSKTELEKTREDFDQIVFLRKEITRIRGLISGG